MNKNNRIAAACLALIVAAGILLPCGVLFPWGGLMDHTFLMDTTWQMLLELSILAVLMCGAARFLKDPLQFYGALLVISGVFIYIHVMTLPVLVSFLYTAGVFLIGRLI